MEALSSSSGEIEIEQEQDWSSANQFTPTDVENLLSMLECSICVDFVVEPTETLCCHKLFCAACVGAWLQAKGTCPLCRAQRPATAVNVVIQRFIAGLSVECKNPGCNARPSRADKEEHERVCEYRVEAVRRRTQERAAALASKRLALEDRLRSGKATAAECLLVARELLEGQEWEHALNIAERARQLQATSQADSTIGEALFALGQWQRALEAFRRAQRPAKVAECQMKLSQYAEAEATLKVALEAPNQQRGEGAEAEAEALGKLGELKKKMGIYAEAMHFVQQALRLVPSERSALWVELKMSEADVLRKTERYDESRKIYVHVLKRAETLLGRKSPQVASCLNALGILTKKLGQYESAIKYYKAAVRVKVFLHGSHNHAQIAEFLTNLADVYRKKSDFAQAEALYRRAMQIFEATVGVNHIEMAETLNGLGLIAKKYARYDEAADLYDRALAICKKVFGDKPHYKAGIFGHNRADVERKRGNYESALRMYADSLEVIRVTLGPQHSEAADPLHAMGLTHHQLGHYDKALDSIAAAIRIVEREFGTNHYKYGVFKSSAGLAKAMLGDYDGAYADLKVSLQVLIQSLGERHVEVADVLAALGDVCVKMFVEARGAESGKLEEGKKYYQRAREICVERLGANHTKVQQMDSLIFIADNYNALM